MAKFRRFVGDFTWAQRHPDCPHGQPNCPTCEHSIEIVEKGIATGCKCGFLWEDINTLPPDNVTPLPLSLVERRDDPPGDGAGI